MGTWRGEGIKKKNEPIPKEVRVPSKKRYPCKKNKGQHSWRIYSVGGWRWMSKDEEPEKRIYINVACDACWKLDWFNLKKARKKGLLIERDHGIFGNSIQDIKNFVNKNT